MFIGARFTSRLSPGFWLGVPGPLQNIVNTWNVENQLISNGTVDYGGNPITYTYDPWGKRVLQYSVGGATGPTGTIYFYSITGQRLATYTGPYPNSLTQASVNMYFGSRLLAPVDRLGSVRQNGSGPIAYFPWGEERTLTPNGTDKFATYFRDSVINGVGQDYASARYYNYNFGRFWTPDSNDASNAMVLPGNWNKYAYVGDDPVNKNDPTGFCSTDDDPPCIPGDPPFSQPRPTPLCPAFAIMHPRAGACGGMGAGGGVASFNQSIRSQAANAINNMSQGCKSALGQKWNLYNGDTSLLYKVNSSNPNADVFYNGTLAGVANQPMSNWGYSGDSTPTSQVLSSSYAFTGGNGNGSSYNQVVLGPLFFDETAAGQAETLLHEVLHTYTGKDDQGLGGLLGLPASLLTDADTASSAIHTYLTDGCNMTALKQAYGLN
jgi:RHS repeat-associated protein